MSEETVNHRLNLIGKVCPYPTLKTIRIVKTGNILIMVLCQLYG